MAIIPTRRLAALFGARRYTESKRKPRTCRGWRRPMRKS